MKIEDAIVKNTSILPIVERSNEDSKTIEIWDEGMSPAPEMSQVEHELDIVRREFQKDLCEKENLIESKQLEIEELRNETQILYEKIENAEVAENNEKQELQEKFEVLNGDLAKSQRGVSEKVLENETLKSRIWELEN